MDRLSPKDVKRFSEILRRRRNDLIRTRAGQTEQNKKPLSESTGDLSHVHTHPGDVGTDEFQRDLDAELSEVESAEIRELDAAAARLASGSYGICESCGRPIPFERLEAKPEARRCIECERLMETRNGDAPSLRPPPAHMQRSRTIRPF